MYFVCPPIHSTNLSLLSPRRILGPLVSWFWCADQASIQFAKIQISDIQFFMHPFTRSFVHSPTHSLAHSFVLLPIHSPIHSLIHSFKNFEDFYSVPALFSHYTAYQLQKSFFIISSISRNLSFSQNFHFTSISEVPCTH